MSTDWYAYKTKAGETLFFYNTKTREHRWAKKCNRLQLELVKNEYDDHNKNCGTSNGMRAENSPSVWRPYNSIKSGKTLFYYNIITGEHKWGLNPHELSSSIPSEPVSLRDDVMDTSSFRNEDQNGNTINLALEDPIEVKKENAHDVIDQETQDVTENEPEIQQTSTAEKQSEKQFLEELNSIEPNSGFMALRSTVKKRNISYVDSNQTTLQQNSYSEEYLSDGISSSDDDDCSNFSDELPDISTSEGEEEDEEEDEKARKNRRRSKYDLQNLNAKNSRIRKSVGVSLNDDGLSQDRIREDNQGQQACVRQLTSTHENIPRMNGIPTIQDITNANNRALFHRQELQARSTSNDSMPTITCAFSIVNSNDPALEKVGFEKSQNSIDSTGLSIYQPDSKFKNKTSERSGNISTVAQINATLQRRDLNPILEKDSREHACSITKEGKIDTQSIPSNNDDNMPTIGEVFSLPENTAKLEVAKFNFEKANRSLENIILSINQPNSQFGYQASPAVCNNSVELQKPDDLSNLTSDGTQEAQSSYIGTSAFDEGNHFSTPSLQMTQSVESRLDNEADCHLSKLTTGEDSESKLPSKDPEDVSSEKDALENENLIAQLQSKDSSKSSSCDFVEENSMSSGTEGSTLEPEQVVSDRGFEQEEEGYATMRSKSHDIVSKHSSEMHVKEQENVKDTMEGSQHSQQASNQDQNHEICSKGVVESDASDTEFPTSPERDSAVAKTTTSTQEQPTSLNNVNYRYHYSIKCLLPMIGIVPTHGDTGNIRCDNLRPTMILNSRFLGVLPNSNSLTASNTSRPDRTELLSSMTADGDKDDPLAPVIAGRQNDPRTFANRSERNDLLPNQEERTNCSGSDHGQVLSPLLNNKSYLPQGASFMASENALIRNIVTTYENHVSYRRDTLTFSDAETFTGLPYILENLYARYKCCYCGKDFRIQEELERHLALRHLLFGGVFLCNSCDDSFISQEEFAKHLLLHDEVKPVKCRHCKEEFVTVEELACHLSTHADDPKYPQYQRRRKVDEGSTTETTDQDSAENDLQDEDKPEKRRNCSYCDRSFKHYFAFRLHLKTHSQVDDFKCLLCGKWYLDLTSLRKHVVIHLREKRLECGICHKTFRFHSDYLQHQLVHVKGQLFRCESRGCREVFKAWDELRKHEIAMHEERRYRCTQCGKSFSRQEKLQNHILLHTGEKPLECGKCGRRFRIRRILRNHEKIHLEAKTFKCPVCSKGFKQKCSMLRHVKTHNFCPKEYQCNLCKKRFTQSCSLQRHLRIHSGERFKCPKCSMKFLEAWRMRVHIAKKHSEE